MRSLMMVLALVAGSVAAAPVVTASQTTASSGTSHVVAIPAGAAGETIVVIVAASGVGGPNDPSFSTADAGWVTNFSAAPRDTPVAVFSKVSDGSEVSLTVNIAVAADAEAVAIRVDGSVGFAVSKNASGESLSPNPMGKFVGVAGDRLVAAIAAAGSAVAGLPAGYGFPAGGSVLTVSYRSLLGTGDDPSAYSLAAVAKWQTLTLVFY